MEQTLQALGGILLKAIPTVILLIFLHWYLKLMFFAPVAKILKERREMTEGAKRAAEKSLENADRKARDFEAKLRDVRSQVYKEQEEMRRQWLEDQAAQVARARERMEASVRDAKQSLSSEIEATKQTLSGSASTIADQIADRVLARRAA